MREEKISEEIEWDRDSEEEWERDRDQCGWGE